MGNNYTTGNVDRSVVVVGDNGRIDVRGYTPEQVKEIITQIRTTFQAKPFDGRSPYVGLVAFEENDADRFFGRDMDVAKLMACVQTARAIFLTGPSGSGKSSVARAGLIPQLKDGRALPGSETWLYATMKPRRAPLDELARVVTGWAKALNAGDDIRNLGRNDVTVLHRWADSVLGEPHTRRAFLLVDQFEELFSPDIQEEDRVTFLHLLIHATTVEDGRVTVLFALRSDFISSCARYPALNSLLNQQFFQLSAMEPTGLISAIAQPGLRVGLQIDPQLVAHIVKDMRDAPGMLPMMQFALKDLFDAQQAKGGIIALSLEDYHARGGIQNALKNRAEATFADLNEDEQRVARAIFLGVIEVRDDRKDTRRTAWLGELVPVDGNEAMVKTVVHKLADARLLVTDERDERDTVTLAHERLIEAWPRLRTWLDETREARLNFDRLRRDFQEWDRRGRRRGYLAVGAQLDRAKAWAANFQQLREPTEEEKKLLEFAFRSIVNEGTELASWMRTLEMLKVIDPVELAKDSYLKAPNEEDRRRGLDILLHAPKPEANSQVYDAVLERILEDESESVRNHAAKVLARRCQASLLAHELRMTHVPLERSRLLHALAYARNVPDDGKHVDAAVRGRYRFPFKFFVARQLVSSYFTEILRVFAATVTAMTVVFMVHNNVVAYNIRGILGLEPEKLLDVASPYTMWESLVITLTIGFYVAIRKRIDNTSVTTVASMSVGLLVALIMYVVPVLGFIARGYREPEVSRRIEWAVSRNFENVISVIEQIVILPVFALILSFKKYEKSLISGPLILSIIVSWVASFSWLVRYILQQRRVDLRYDRVAVAQISLVDLLEYIRDKVNNILFDKPDILLVQTFLIKWTLGALIAFFCLQGYLLARKYLDRRFSNANS